MLDGSNTGKIYRFNSYWNQPTNPTMLDEGGNVVANPAYVNPAGPWTPPSTADGDTQADNPSNYKGWGFWDVGNVNSYDKGVQLYNNGTKTYQRVKSQAFVWQAYLFENTLVPSIGWRRDVFKGSNVNAPRTTNDQVNPNDPTWKIDPDTLPVEAGESISYSVVAHAPKFIRDRLPFGTNFSLFYNQSQNFQPRPGQVDMFGDPLANPTGDTKDYGFVVSVLDDRLSLKVNWYKTNVTNDRLNGFQFWKIDQFGDVLLQRAFQLNHKDEANSWKWDYGFYWGGGDPAKEAVEQAKADAGAAAVLDAYNTNPVFKQWIDGWKYNDAFLYESSTNDVPPGLAATTDTTSKGIEFELAGKPTKNWNVSLNVAKTSATQQNIGGALKTWIEAMTPLANGPAGDLRQWWAGDSNNLRGVWDRDIMAQFRLLKVQEGSDVPELRRWRFNVVSGYDFTHGLLKGINVGVAYRWEDSVVTGYPVIETTNDEGVIDYFYDVKNPYKGPKENHVDFWIGYGRKLTSKIDWRIQLNVRDALASKKLIPISVNPDGSPAAYRIPELTSWSITNTFTF
jgi:hypothetical protein